MWLTAYRISENNFTSPWPDFLSNHDSGTIEGVVAIMTSFGNETNMFFGPYVPVVFLQCTMALPLFVMDDVSILYSLFFEYVILHGT